MEIFIDFIKNNWMDILIIIGGFTAIITYYCQNRDKESEAAALIVTQIQELKDKILSINNISADNIINEKAFYESLDIITDNQWEKYKHLFIKKMDSNSFKTINQFYECILRIREQILFVKNLEYQHYFNIQGMLDTNCNNNLIDTLQAVISNPNMISLKNSISKKENKSKEEEFFIGAMDELIKANPNYDMNEFWKTYNMKKSLLKSIINSSPYIQYVPSQVSITINEQLKNIRTIEVIGCEGFRKLTKIAKIK